MKAVINSGPLMALAKLNLLQVLKSLFDKVYVPKSVYDEVVLKGLRKGSQDAKAVKVFIKEDKNFIGIKKSEKEFRPKIGKLDVGERDVIELGQRIKTDFVLMDDARARAEAIKAGLKVKGTLGVFVSAYKSRAISFREIKYIFNEIKSRSDIWINAKLCDEILENLEKRVSFS